MKRGREETSRGKEERGQGERTRRENEERERGEGAWGEKSEDNEEKEESGPRLPLSLLLRPEVRHGRIAVPLLQRGRRSEVVRWCREGDGGERHFRQRRDAQAVTQFLVGLEPGAYIKNGRGGGGGGGGA